MTDPLQPLLDRFNNDYKSIGVPDSWVPVLLRLDESIARLDPDYTISQVKVKFNELRYYCSVNPAVQAEVSELIYDAEYECYALGNS